MLGEAKQPLLLYAALAVRAALRAHQGAAVPVHASGSPVHIVSLGAA